MNTVLQTAILAITLATSGSLLAETPVTAGSTAPRPGWFRRTFGTLTWSETLSVVESPKDICDRVKCQVTYRKDRDNIWTTGAETWKRGYGDCDQIARCVQDLCDTKGFPAETFAFVTTRGERRGHAAVIGTWNRELWVSSNGSWKTVRSQQAAKQYIARITGWNPQDVAVVPLARQTVDLSSQRRNAGSFTFKRMGDSQ